MNKMIYKPKSLSYRKQEDSLVNARILSKQVRLKDTLLKPVSVSIDKDDELFMCETSPDAQKRSKSITKKPLLHRRNIQQLISSREKVTYSTNSNTVKPGSKVRYATSDNYKRQENFQQLKFND
mmetsp:Transcript_42877/g.50286  ORF Transcript_42877/g.50286 Transcript_42877/m.50286 type:complete len:124 (+) Transcript_42877:318-689(+)